MSISTITIATVDYISYASLAEAEPYLAIDPVRGATWDLLTDDQKGGMLVAATRRLDMLIWAGEKTGGDAQANGWPRTGAYYPSGGSVSTSEVPVEMGNATILLAGTIAGDSDSAGAGTSGSNVKTASAGSASVEFFRSTEGVQLQDESAFTLVSAFLAGSQIATGVSGAYVSGDDATSSFNCLDLFGTSSGFP